MRKHYKKNNWEFWNLVIKVILEALETCKTVDDVYAYVNKNTDYDCSDWEQWKVVIEVIQCMHKRGEQFYDIFVFVVKTDNPPVFDLLKN